MEVYPRSSWFLVLLGFALIAVTLQETTDCPAPDQVSCTSGIKCNSNEDCQNKEKCCANPCYTKRCVPVPKDLRGDVETDGPSENDCRPYIEKALKELETGEVALKEPSEKDESTEDIPTVEITDDSSHQEDEDGGASDETDGEEDQSPEEDETQQEAAQESVHDDKSKEESGETPDEKGMEKSDERPESEEETIAKQESDEEIEQASKASVEDDANKKKETQQEAASIESQEKLEIPRMEEAEIVKRAAPEIPTESVVVQAAADSHAEEPSAEETEASEEGGDDDEVEVPEAESKQESVEEADDDNTNEAVDEESTENLAPGSEDESSSENESAKEGGCPPPNEVSCTEGELCTKHRNCGENEICCPNKCYRRRCTAGSVPQEELDAESASEESEEAKSEEKSNPSTSEGGCPPPNEVSCTEGELCTKHRNCGSNAICCPNKCYRRRCTPGSVPQDELDAESESEESEEEKSEEKSHPSTPEGGCPAPNELSCTGGELCTKHRNCGENEICCPNKCYRRRCTPGSVPQEELDAESASEESEEAKSEEKTDPSSPETGCPPPSQVSCTDGDLCSKHRHCGDEQICCPNKCYRRRCTPGTATSAELAAELDDDSQEESEEKSAEKPAAKRPDTGCPVPNEVSCVEGDLCSKHKHCGPKEICCPNKCYRRRCTPGTPTDEDLEGESDEDSKEEENKGASSAPSVPRKDTGCPERGGVPCGGEKCNKNKECGTGEICCANKCYRKVCVTGKPASDEEEEDSEEETKEDTSVEAAPGADSQEEGGCPSPDKVSCVEGVRCGDDSDCDSEEICCPNKCYNKRCIPGTKKDGEESAEGVSAEEPPPPPPKPKVKIPEKVVEAKKVYRAPPPPPPPPTPKKEVKKPEIKVPVIPAKPISFESTIEDDESLEKSGEAPVEELSLDTDFPTDLRSRDHVEQLLKIDQDATKLEKVHNKVYEETLKELKRLYENAIKPLEVLYKYRDLSNRHFGDAEIFSKPLILFMGPWSGGKSSIINYLLNNEYNETSLRTGAEPSPAYFNILMHGDEPEIIDGTELAADFTFSGLQKFGQGLEERLRGVKLPVRLLEKVNIVEIPGILEVRKQVSRVFPFNDACQWFIDRADIIFLVYDPSKLDVGPETEAILDQLKGREHQTRIILNKADQVKPEELMRVQGALIWNISPLMSSPQPPVMYTTSLWSRSYEPWAPIRLLQAQERAFLRDLRTAVDRRVENKIASARRFAVRVRNHAKMVDCYLTTYYNHKSVFGNRKQVANEIIERPQDYHIYEGLSTLTNISRYDLPDPDVYRDFFKLNPLYEFQQLSATCTYFRGCPINRLDIAIAYDLPELIGTYKRHLEEAITTANNPPKESAPSAKKTKKSAPGS